MFRPCLTFHTLSVTVKGRLALPSFLCSFYFFNVFLVLNIAYILLAFQ